MGGRLQILVLVMALAARPSMQSRDLLNHLANRCRNTAGEKAAVDLLNIIHQLNVCTRNEDLYGEVITAMQTRGPREAINIVCRRKDELLTCANQAYETIKRCLKEEEKEVLTLLQGTIKPAMDFVCEHDDEILTIFESQEESLCVTTLATTAEECAPHDTKGDEKILDSFLSLEKNCKELDGFMSCINAIPKKCKDSTALRLLNAMKREVVDVAVCSKKVEVSGATARVGTLSEHLERLILSVIVSYILRL